MSDKDQDVNPEQTNIDNVTPLETARANKKRTGKSDKPSDAQAESPEKPPRAILFENIFLAVTRSPASILPEPNFRIEMMNIADGVDHPVQIVDNEVCRKINMKQLTKLFMDYTRELRKLRGHWMYSFTANDVHDCVLYWQMAATAIPTPKPIRFHSEMGLTLLRMPFEISPMPTPLFDEIFSRMTNGDAVKAYLWSMVEYRSFRQQYLWLQGEGNDSKGALARTFIRLFQKNVLATAQQNVPWSGNKHWALPFYDKRLIVFTDFRDLRSLSNSIMLSLTGGDSLSVDPKGSAPFDADFYGKIIFCSQLELNIDDRRADKRRPIKALLQETTKYDPEYEEKLWLEMPGFLYQCCEVYERLCPNHGKIPVSQESAESIEAAISVKNDEYEIFFDRYLERDDEHRPVGYKIVPEHLLLLLKHVFQHERPLQDGFKRWLEMKGYKRKRSSCKDDTGSRAYFYPGIRIKPHHQPMLQFLLKEKAPTDR